MKENYALWVHYNPPKKKLIPFFKTVIFVLLIALISPSVASAYSTDDQIKNSGNTVVSMQKAVTGTVTDSETGQVMPGVAVMLKGTTVGAFTDADGKYSIPITDQDNAILQFSFVGYQSEEVALAGRTVLDMALKSKLTDLDEIVVIGYGTARRSDLTGATASVKSEDVINIPAPRVDQALQGKSPGIVIQNTSAAPDGTFVIRIRGANSLQGSNDPLVVVDGFIGGSLSSINPNDIENIEILKDASATAIYGSRGANGVILITTKKGADGVPTVEYNGYVTLQKLAKKMDLLNAGEYAETTNANRADLGLSPAFSESEVAYYKANGGTDWQDVVFRPALQQNHQVSVSGGSKTSNYYLSGNYVNNEGIIIGSSYNRASVRSNMEIKVGKKFTVGGRVYASKSANHPSQTGGSQDLSPTQAALIWSPTQAKYKEDGVSYTLPSSAFGPPSVFNPLALAVEPVRDYMSVRNELNTFVNYDIIEGLSARFIFGTLFDDRENSTYSNTKPAGGVGDASASITNSRSWVYQTTSQLNYVKTINRVHSINATAAYEYQREDYNYSNVSAAGFSSDVAEYNNLAIATKPGVPSSSETRKDIISFVGRINYSFADKYLISLNSRYDGASVFGDDKWGFFPSGALAWRVSNEEFMKQFSAISNLKLRASYGITGSQAVNAYASLSRLNTSYPYAIGSGAITGVGLGSIENKDLSWEKTGQLDIGMDLGLFKGRITITADYYKKVTTDLLMSVPLPRVTGYSSVLRNVGSVQNQGVEFDIGGYPLTGDLKWNTNLNFALNRNKVLELSGEDEIAVGTTGFPNFGNTIFLEIGQPIGLLRGYIQDGCWGTDEAAEAAGFGTIPGAPKYVDQNHDGSITSADIVNMGTTQPKFTYGWTNNFSYKSFDLSILFQGSYGNKVYNLTRVRSERSSSDADATDRRILNRWTEDNQDTDVPSFIGSNQYEKIQSNRWLEDGSYLRLKNLTLGYSLPASVIGKLNISTARIYVSAVNALTITRYTGFDPEASTDTDINGGIDMAPYPSQKSLTFGVNIKF